MRALAHVLGLEAVENQLKTEPGDGFNDGEIETLIGQRKEARKSNKFTEGDRIRDRLKEQDIILVDQSEGMTTWHCG